MNKIITIITDSSGIGAGKLPNEKLWNVHIKFTAYKELDNTIIHKDGVLLKQCTDDELNVLRNSLKKDSIARVSVNIIDNELYLKDILEIDINDKDLNKILEDQLKPIYYYDNFFGEFNLDKSINVFTKSIKWINSDITLSFENSNENDILSSLKTAFNLFDNKLKYDKELKEFASNELLELKNDCWLDEEENEISKDDFINNLEVDYIDVSPDGDFTIYCDDNNMFWGHSIIISGNINTGLETANI